MNDHLPDIYAALAGLSAPLVHYKVCSTFDSAPHIGSIGRAIDLGAAVIPGAWVPLIVGAPAIARYQVFGNLFAGIAGTGYRLDRHPTMSRHPVTPMAEADLTRHLALQTARRIGLVDFVALQAGRGENRLAAEIATADHPVVAIDVLDELTLAAAGRLIWGNRRNCRFVAGSQGVEYALVAHWREEGLILRSPPEMRAPSVPHIAVVSGSCSPTTAGQIAYAEHHGFDAIRLDATLAVDTAAWAGEIERVVIAALGCLGRGASPVVYTARGPDDPAIPALAEVCRSAGCNIGTANDRIGDGLGRVLAGILAASGLSRALIAGGDTSGHATLALGVDALSTVAAVAPGSPLCRAHAADPRRDGLELALKGGQIGGPDYFCAVREGGPLRAS
jgi:uncharacterized protein YgbK (DUF1537 family)